MVSMRDLANPAHECDTTHPAHVAHPTNPVQRIRSHIPNTACVPKEVTTTERSSTERQRCCR